MTEPAVTPAVSAERAREAAKLLRVRRSRQFRPSLYQVYATVLGIGIYGALVANGISDAIGPGLTARTIGIWGVGILALALLTVLRSGAWQGPVVFSRGDVAFLLAAPIALVDLVRPKLTQALLVAAFLGGVTGALVVVSTAAGFGGLGAPRSVGAVVAFACLGELAVALSWLVERSLTATRWVLRLSPVAVAVAIGLALAGGSGSTGRSVTVWTGPWGWALAPVTGTSGWAVGVGLTALVCVAGVAVALARCGYAPTERFLAQAETRSQLAASATNLDYRSAALARRSATAIGRPSRRRLPRPKPASLAVAWRDAVALLRTPSRLVWAAALGAAATLEVIGHPGRPLPAGIAAILLYFAAGALTESLRADVDDPERSRMLLGWDYGRVLVAHCFVPGVVLSVISGVTVIVAVVVGVGTTGPALLAVVPTLVAPIVAVAVFCAALGARSGGRIGQSVILRVLSSAATDPMGGASAILYVAPWLLLEIVAVAIPVLMLGDSVRHHRPPEGVAGLCVILTVAIASGLMSAVRGSKRVG